jgi:hypothetical protein
MRATLSIALALGMTACGGDAVPDEEAKVTAESPAGPSRPIEATVVQCTHTEEASIYNVKAAQWRAEYYGSGAVQSLNLTVWRPAAGGPDQFSLAASQDGNQYRIDTVEGSQQVGSGTITMEPDADGGARFSIDGKDQNGHPLRATVSCGEFIEPVAEGG